VLGVGCRGSRFGVRGFGVGVWAQGVGCRAQGAGVGVRGLEGLGLGCRVTACRFPVSSRHRPASVEGGEGLIINSQTRQRGKSSDT